ncbi:Clp protease N-terminal domain-containing protein [Streptomyces sp. NPDC059909]|uniref:Clp protease N-terminal domain-containing protein n=1 Tax=Streptomyces sp. NPDC059909 TaxID=3346998 RepID=UPI00364FB3B3
MFERFTQGARAVVTGAVVHAERTGAASVTTEHMLLALLDQEGTKASFAFRSLGVADRRASVESSLVDARRRAGLSKADTEALAGLGIDVAEIVARVEETHGAGALAGDRKGGGKGGRPGHRPYSREAKDALVKSLRIALGRRERAIGDEHILLALAAGPGIVAEVLADHGATYATLERAMFPSG